MHPKVRLGQAHSCVLVLLGARLDGTKELIAPAEGLRESSESWAGLLRDCRRRGMRDSELVVGDGAMGLWRALYNAEDRAHAEKAIAAFAKTYGARFPKAVAKITDDAEELRAFYSSAPAPASNAATSWSGPRWQSHDTAPPRRCRPMAPRRWAWVTRGSVRCRDGRSPSRRDRRGWPIRR